MTKPRVLVSNIMMLNERERFEKKLIADGYQPIFPDVDQFLSEQELLDLVGDIDAILAGDDQITDAVLQKSLPRLKVISKWGTGVDSIDLLAAKKLGVPVHNTPGAFKDAVAEIAIGYMLDLSRFISYTNSTVRQGNWIKPRGTGLVNQTLGVIGIGAIGQGVAKRARAMDMNIIAYDPFFERHSIDSKLDVDNVDLESLLKQSDFVCLTCNLTQDNKHIINADSFKMMKPSSYIINVARGQLVCEISLTEALLNKSIAGAGLDVYETEPLPEGHPLTSMENVILGCHNANNTVAAVEYVHENTLINLYAYFNITC